MSRLLFLIAVCASLLGFGCTAVGGVTDGSSVSYGWGNGGRLLAPATLFPIGKGYRIPATWHDRGLMYGTDELVGLIARSAAQISEQAPGAQLYVADLSLRSGGRSAFHRSHQSGRDVDLLFYALDEEGEAPRSVPQEMTRFDEQGMGLQGTIPVRFDTRRNWLLVKTLLSDPYVEVQYIFVSYELQHLLIAHAIESGESSAIIHKASNVMHQPGDSLPHNDHFHVRIYCDRSDLGMGCRDRGPLRWLKKTGKYAWEDFAPDWLDTLASRLSQRRDWVSTANIGKRILTIF